MIRAYITDAQWGASIAVSLVMHGEQPDDPRRILHFESVGEGEAQQLIPQWHTLEPYAAGQPTLSLGHDLAVALMQALNTHYAGVDDQRTLRADYVAERARVDKLIDAVAEIARVRAA